MSSPATANRAVAPIQGLRGTAVRMRDAVPPEEE